MDDTKPGQVSIVTLPYRPRIWRASSTDLPLIESRSAASSRTGMAAPFAVTRKSISSPSA